MPVKSAMKSAIGTDRDAEAPHLFEQQGSPGAAVTRVRARRIRPAEASPTRLTCRPGAESRKVAGEGHEWKVRLGREARQRPADVALARAA